VDDQVKVTAQLIDAARDKLVWADSYSRDVRDILILQSELARIIAREVLQEISPEQEAMLTETRRIDPAVYDFYMRGQQKLEDVSYHEARQYFEQAIALDSSFAPAQAGLAVALQMMGHWGGWGLPRAEANLLAKQAAQKALELDENLSDSHAAMAMVAYLQDWDWVAAEKAFQRAIELDPVMRGRDSSEQYSLYLCYSKRFEECLTVVRRGIELDPLNQFNHRQLGYMMFNAGEWEQAEAHFKAMLERWPNYFWAKLELAWTYVVRGRPDLAFPLYEDIDTKPNFDSLYLAAWLASGGEPEVRTFLAERKMNYLSDAEAGKAVGIARGHLFLDEPDSVVTWLEKVEAVTVGDSNGNWAYHMAVIYSMLGDQEKGLHWLDRAVELDAPRVLAIQIDWELDGLRDHPEFAAVVNRVGFPER
jgi:Tfp pilus assembly protein PilF